MRSHERDALLKSQTIWQTLFQYKKIHESINLYKWKLTWKFVPLSDKNQEIISLSPFSKKKNTTKTFWVYKKIFE